MGSSPVTATIPSPIMDVLRELEAFFQYATPLEDGDGVVVAFSGGPDSTALLWGMSRLAACRGTRVYAAHLDHVMDAGSAGRAAAAAGLAERLGVPLIQERSDVPAGRRSGESLEAAPGRRPRRPPGPAGGGPGGGGPPPPPPPPAAGAGGGWPAGRRRGAGAGAG